MHFGVYLAALIYQAAWCGGSLQQVTQKAACDKYQYRNDCDTKVEPFELLLQCREILICFPHSIYLLSTIYSKM